MPGTTVAELLSHDNEKRFSAVVKKATDDVWQKYIEMCRKRAWGNEIPDFFPTKKEDRLHLYPNIVPSLHVPKPVFRLLPKEQRMRIRQGISCGGPIPIPLEPTRDDLYDPRLRCKNYGQKNQVDLKVIDRKKWGESILYNGGDESTIQEKRACLSPTPKSPHQNTNREDKFSVAAQSPKDKIQKCGSCPDDKILFLKEENKEQQTPLKKQENGSSGCRQNKRHRNSAIKRWRLKNTPHKQPESNLNSQKDEHGVSCQTTRKISWFPFLLAKKSASKRSHKQDNVNKTSVSQNTDVLENGSTEKPMETSDTSNNEKNVSAVWTNMFSKIFERQKALSRNQQIHSAPLQGHKEGSHSNKVTVSETGLNSFKRSINWCSNATENKHKLIINQVFDKEKSSFVQSTGDETKQMEHVPIKNDRNRLFSFNENNNSQRKGEIDHDVDNSNNKFYKTEVIGLKMKIHVVTAETE